MIKNCITKGLNLNHQVRIFTYSTIEFSVVNELCKWLMSYEGQMFDLNELINL